MKLFKLLFINTKHSIKHELLPIDDFHGVWFPDKDSESAKTQMNLETGGIVDLHVLIY